MENIPKQVEEVLSVLASKFGETGARLWGSLVKEQKLQAVSGWVTSVLLIIFGLFLWHIAPSADSGSEFLWWSLPITAVILFLLAIVNIREIWVRSQNPEYGALKDVAEMFSPKSDK